MTLPHTPTSCTCTWLMASYSIKKDIKTFEYLIHWNINNRKNIFFAKKINGSVGWNKHSGEQHPIKCQLCLVRELLWLLEKKNSCLVAKNSFIWYCRSASNYFPYFRVIPIRRYWAWSQHIFVWSQSCYLTLMTFLPYPPIKPYLNQCFECFQLLKCDGNILIT